MLKASSMQGDAAQAALQPHDARSTSHTRSKRIAESGQRKLTPTQQPDLPQNLKR